MNRRRALLALLALASPMSLHAQPGKAPHRIGWLTTLSQANYKDVYEAFSARMKELGYVEGRDYVLEVRMVEERLDRLPALAREILATKPAVVVTGSSGAIAAFKKETNSVPIVFGSAADVVEQKLVASLARPGGNITGVALRAEVSGKLVQLIREVQPAVRRIALLEHEGDPVAARSSEAFRQAADTLGFRIGIVRIKRVEDLERAFAEITRDKSEAIIAPRTAMFARHAKAIADLALKARLPLYSPGEIAQAGALMSYYSDLRESYRRVASLVDKILKGAKPADLPVEEPDRFVLEINLRTARALGIAIPQAVLIRADQVIE